MIIKAYIENVMSKSYNDDIVDTCGAVNPHDLNMTCYKRKHDRREMHQGMVSYDYGHLHDVGTSYISCWYDKGDDEN